MTRKGVGRALLVGALALAGCVGSYERAIDETRAELIGLSGRDLRRCLGVPTDFDREDGVEYLTYRWVFKPQQPMGVTTGIGSGGIGGIVVGRQDAGGGYDSARLPARPVGAVHLSDRLRAAQGRRHQGDRARRDRDRTRVRRPVPDARAALHRIRDDDSIGVTARR